MKLKLIYTFACMLCLLCCCNDDHVTIENDSDSVFTWDEEFWQNLQTDSNFIKIRELIHGVDTAFNALENNLDDADEEKRQVAVFIALNDSMLKAIKPLLLVLHDKYKQFSYHYYFELLKTIDTPDFSAKSTGYEVIGDCRYVMQHYWRISIVMCKLRDVYNSMLCDKCRRSRSDLNEIVIRGLRRHAILSNTECDVLKGSFYQLVSYNGRYPLCEDAALLARKLSLYKSSIRDVAGRITRVSSYLAYPEQFFGVGVCKENKPGPPSGGGSGGGGNPGNPPIPPEKPNPNLYGLNLRSSLLTIEASKKYDLVLTIYNKNSAGPPPTIVKVEYLIRRKGLSDFVSLKEKNSGTTADLRHNRKAISFGTFEIVAEAYIRQQTQAIRSNIVTVREVCPSISSFKDLPVVQNRAVELWNTTVAYSRQNQSTRKTKEFGCFIYINTETGEYRCGEDIPGNPVTLDAPVKGTVEFTYTSQMYDPRESFDLIVGTIHSHYPLTWAVPGLERDVGPSPDDKDSDLPGIVYDYTKEVFSGNPVDMSGNPKKIYTYGPAKRATP